MIILYLSHPRGYPYLDREVQDCFPKEAQLPEGVSQLTRDSWLFSTPESLVYITEMGQLSHYTDLEFHVKVLFPVNS